MPEPGTALPACLPARSKGPQSTGWERLAPLPFFSQMRPRGATTVYTCHDQFVGAEEVGA